MKRILILSPHQDDEILSSYYLLKKTSHEKNLAYIAFATNGDYHGEEIARMRYYESIRAIMSCNVSPSHVFFLGYSDTGMRSDNSFLWNLYYNNTIPCKTKHTKTWHPNNLKTFHNMLYAEEAAYTRDSFVQDLYMLFKIVSPDILIIPSYYDLHGDHHALYMFVTYVMNKYHLFIPIWCYLIHSKDERKWPNRTGDFFEMPQNVPQAVWEKRIVISGDASLKNTKKRVIASFISQAPKENNEFLLSFAKNEEVFLVN